MLTFQQGTKLIIDNGTDRHELLISSGTATQTFLEAVQKVKTIHNPNLIERSFTKEKGAVNLNFKCQVSNDPVLLEWFGFDEADGASDKKHIIDPLKNLVVKYDVYIVAEGTIYKLADCVGQNLSFTLSRQELLQVDVTGIAPNIVEVVEVPSTGSLVTQGAFYNAPITIVGDSGAMSDVVSVTCEVTRGVSFTGEKSLFDLADGGIYTPKNAVLKTLAISGSITQNKVDTTDTTNEEDVLIRIQYGDSFKIHLATCNTTSRWNMAAIHQRVTDYKLQPEIIPDDSFIKF